MHFPVLAVRCSLFAIRCLLCALVFPGNWATLQGEKRKANSFLLYYMKISGKGISVTATLPDL
jgi:hypothetical protein